MIHKRLSIILVSKNNHLDVKHTLDSLYGIEKLHYEILIIDSSKSSSVKSLVSQYKHFKSLKYYWTQPRGIYNAMNFGLEASAKQSYVWFLNPGDILLNLDCVHQVLEKFSSLKVDYCITQSVYANKPHIRNNFFPKNDVTLTLENFILGNLAFSHQATFVDKKVFNHGILFDENYTIAADYKLQYLLVKYFKGALIANLAVQIDTTGVSHRKVIKTLLETTLIIFRDGYFSLSSALIYFMSRFFRRLYIAFSLRVKKFIK